MTRAWGLLMIGTALLWESGSVAGRSQIATVAPSNYRLEDVTLTVARNAGALMAPPERLNIFGAGISTLERDGIATPLHYPQKDIISLLNQLYRLRFTELPSRFDTKYSVVRAIDGSLNTTVSQMKDVVTSNICLTIATFKKCVTIGADAPADLETFVQRALADAEKFRASKQGQ